MSVLGYALPKSENSVFSRGIRVLIGLALLLIVSPAAAADSSAQSGNAQFGRYVVLLEDSVGHPAAVARTHVEQRNGRLGFVYRHALKGYSALLPKEAVAALRADPRVERVAPDREVKTFAQAVPTGIDRVFATVNEALDIDEEEGYRVDADVAVIDGGTDPEHPDLDVTAWTDCSGAVEEKCLDESGSPSGSHGTHVAGTVGAIDSGFGVVGVAPGARIWSVQVLGAGKDFDSRLAAGIDWVTSHADEIEVANMSLGCQCELTATAAALEGSVEKGVVYVAAAGNADDNVSKTEPASLPDVIAVSALADFDGKPGEEAGTSKCREAYEAQIGSQGDDTLANFSNWGSGIDVAAPGACILSTVPAGGYAEVGWSGTSMASPHVAGAAAILASQSNPENQGDVAAIGETIIEEGNLNWSDTSGDGVQERLLDVGDEEVFGAPEEEAEAPTVKTEAATNVTYLSADLHGTVDPNGGNTTYRFEYGTSTEYGSSVPIAAKSVGSDAEETAVTVNLHGLVDQTTYHFRIAATNSAGTSYGEDRSFTTSKYVEWSIGTTPNPSKAEGSEQTLDVVDCFSENWCMALGHYANGEGAGELAELWNGEEWSIVTTPSAFEMNDVVCHAKLSCAAVGSKEGQAQVQTWSQSAGWKSMLLPSIEGEDSSLSGISCSGTLLTQLSCAAVGTRSVAGTDETLALRFTGAKWELLTTPNAGDASALDAVDCNSATDCAAVGNYTEEGQEKPLAMHWGGEEWSIQSVPASEAEGEDTYLADVSCAGGAAPTECVAVGANLGESSQSAVSYSWNGEKWTEQQVAVPVGGSVSSLDSVSCGTEGCVAAGPAKVESLAVPLAEAWDGSEWEALEPIDPSSGKGATLTGISCLSTLACVAVGSYSSSGATLTLGEHRAEPPGEPSGPTAPSATTEAASGVTTSKATLNGTVNPNGASTTYQFEYGTTESYGSKVPASPQGIGSGTSNVAVDDAIEGLAAETTYHFRVVATNSKGTTYGNDKTFTTEAEEAEPEWAIVATANPSEAEGSEQTLTDVSCYSGTWCMAIGSYSNGEGSGALAEYWDGEAWTIVSVPSGVVLNDILCRPFANECSAVGRKEGQVWARRWNKAFPLIWFDMKPPTPEGAEGSEFNGGDCSPKNEIYECVVVGSYTVSGEERPLAMEWIIAKQEWVVLSPPTKGEDSSFNAVSCNEEGSCTAVGRYVESGEELPLAAHWNGAEWSVQSVPTIEAEGEDTSLADVACTGEAGPSTDCVAVGSNQGGAPQTGVAVFWNGEQWEEAEPVTPGGLAGDFSLSGVSCASQSECYAVGEYDSAAEGAGTKPLAEEWNGTAWSISPTPSPAGKSWSGLGSVSCGASFKCLAVGFGESAARTDTLAMRHE